MSDLLFEIMGMPLTWMAVVHVGMKLVMMELVVINVTAVVSPLLHVCTITNKGDC